MTVELPEWIRVWAWYRQTHPDDRRPFPQQAIYAGEVTLDYAEAHRLWLERDRTPAGETPSGATDGEQEFLAFMVEANIAGKEAA